MKASKPMSRRSVLVVSGLALSLFGAGCASSTPPTAGPADPPAAALQATEAATPVKSAQSAATAPVPKVQDCGIVAISSPPKYVCNGKVYTAVQLAKLRADEAKKYQSGQ